MEPAEKHAPAPTEPGRLTLAGRLLQLLHAVPALLVGALGRLSWTPPAWSIAVAGATRRGAGSVTAFLRAHRRAAIASAAAVVVIALGAALALRWYQSRPRPLLIPVEVTAPPLTAIEVVPRPHPLQVTFGASAARLDRVGKVVAQGVRLEPAVPGEWRFEDDRTLVFRPAQDWPVGQRYRVTLDKALFPEHVRLATRELTFETAPFVASIERAEFYQDPVDPRLKQVVVALAFSHPVDTADLARHVRLHLQGAKGGLFGLGATGRPFTVSFDKLAGHAYVKSESIPIPEDDTVMVVTLEKGARAARGGPPTEEPISTEVKVPGMFSYFRVAKGHVTLVPNERLEPEQVLVLETSAGATEEEIGKHVAAWILPRNRPAREGEPEVKNYRWHAPEEIGPEILDKGSKLPLARIPADRNDATLHSFKIQAPVGAHALRAHRQGHRRASAATCWPASGRRCCASRPFPKEVKIAQPGSLLSLAGEKKVSILARDVAGLRFEVARVLPGQVAHLVTQSGGTFADPQFDATGSAPTTSTERFEEKRPLQRKAPGKAQYTAFDLSRYLEQGGRRSTACSSSRVQSLGPSRPTRPARPRTSASCWSPTSGWSSSRTPTEPRRLRAVGASGEPAAGRIVEVLGRNGLAVASRHHRRRRGTRTCHRSATSSARRRRWPSWSAAGEDISFLPFERGDRRLETLALRRRRRVTRRDGPTARRLPVLRPRPLPARRQIQVGMIVRAADWTHAAGGHAARGGGHRRARPGGAEASGSPCRGAGFQEISYRTEETSPTGNVHRQPLHREGERAPRRAARLDVVSRCRSSCPTG